MTDDRETFAARGARVAALAQAEGWDFGHTLAAVAAAAGALVLKAEDPRDLLPSVQAVTAAAAGLQEPDGPPSPCAACWDALVAEARECEHSGAVSGRCPHRSLGFLANCDAGEVTGWTIRPMSAEELEAANAEARRALFDVQGLRPIKH